MRALAGQGSLHLILYLQQQADVLRRIRIRPHVQNFPSRIEKLRRKDGCLVTMQILVEGGGASAAAKMVVSGANLQELGGGAPLSLRNTILAWQQQTLQGKYWRKKMCLN